MEERKINFNRNEDPTTVKDEDGSIAKKLAKLYKDIQLNLGFCYEQLTKGELTEGFKNTVLSLTESQVTDFLDTLGYQGVLARQKEERYTEIRSLNDENRGLRRQLGEKASPEDVREKIKNISEAFDKWWNEEGFGHCSERNFGKYAAEFIVSGSIFGRHDIEAEEDKITKLRDLGFEISKKDKAILMCDKSIQSLERLIKSKYSSGSICDIKTVTWGNEYIMREIKIYISNYNDFGD